MPIIYSDDTDFERKAEGEHGPKMTVFFASWCPHCHHMMPLFEKAAQSYAGKIKIFVVDVDKSPRAAAKYGVKGIPTMLFFNSRGEYTQLSGEQAPEILKDRLNALN